ncbi:putative 4-hydroxy-4-methyl-2-oxoglutarate aldolase [Zobellella taiwanensis]|jgi:regulator of ribonuclease activity A|uniref:4-hydroxy-4-methyl-2-oxoglutarate aldolase n=1 Tax=Zobellella taiwanensis TaxID=347535 RepID=A0A2P7R6X7_9GAMM|nr:putative 4-hydroxy-4-methyl-2-oxoglutarate aldolase [Zobellella taiwanensis]PSJ45954.1 putative 4-hydroxy-4-methyl-2-oxoglutarate aldolase [Zobellella taiwanensis]
MLDLLPDLCDEHADKVRVLEPLFRDYGGETLFWGQAVTVRCYEDNSRVRELVATPGTGKVLVVDGGGLLRCALLGDMLAELALQNGWEGIVVHGAIRDAGTLSTMALGIKALAACPLRSEKRGEGSVEVAVTFAGATIHPGDYIYADLNGILVAREPLSHPQL